MNRRFGLSLKSWMVSAFITAGLFQAFHLVNTFRFSCIPGRLQPVSTRIMIFLEFPYVIAYSHLGILSHDYVLWRELLYYFPAYLILAGAIFLPFRKASGLRSRAILVLIAVTVLAIHALTYHYVIRLFHG